MNKFLLLLTFLFLMTHSDNLIFDFNTTSNIANWKVVDDGVMGGKSNGIFLLNNNGYGVYSGVVSLENNGGFSSLRYRFPEKNIESFTKVKVRLKGDGKNYQFRIKKNRNDAHSYIAVFQTSSQWQTIEITISKMYPAFRGKNLNMPNLSTKTIEEIAFLIGNKKNESFQLELDTIYLE